MRGRNPDPSALCSLTDRFQSQPPQTFFALNQTSRRFSGCIPYFPNTVLRAAETLSHHGSFSPGTSAWISTRGAASIPRKGRAVLLLPWGQMSAHIGDNRRNVVSCSSAPFIPVMWLWGFPRQPGTPQLGAWIWMCLMLLTDPLSPCARLRKAHGDTMAKTAPLPKTP